MEKKFTRLRFLLIWSDIALLNMSLFAVCNDNRYIHHVLPVNVFWILCTSFFRLYSDYMVYKLKDSYEVTWRSIISFAMMYQIYILATVPHPIPAAFILSFLSLFAASSILSRYLFAIPKKLFDLDLNDRTANILAIASVGGHWVELLRLGPLFRQHHVTFISNKSNLAHTVEGNKFHVIPDANRNDILKLFKCFASILRHLVIQRPCVIITTGAAPGLIAIFIGRILGIKTIWIDSIANVDQLSLSGSIATKIANKVYTQWEHLATRKVEFSGSILS